MISTLGWGIVFFIAGLVFITGGLLVSRILAPHNPNVNKTTSYECGEEPIGTAWIQFNMRFYSMGLIFLIFDAESILLFPWVTVFSNINLFELHHYWAIFSLLEGIIFIVILGLGLVYIWQNKDICWVKPNQNNPKTTNPLPQIIYRDYIK